MFKLDIIRTPYNLSWCSCHKFYCEFNFLKLTIASFANFSNYRHMIVVRFNFLPLDFYTLSVFNSYFYNSYQKTNPHIIFLLKHHSNTKMIIRTSYQTKFTINSSHYPTWQAVPTTIYHFHHSINSHHQWCHYSKQLHRPSIAQQTLQQLHLYYIV